MESASRPVTAYRSRVPLLACILAAQLVFYVGMQLGARYPTEPQQPGRETAVTRWRRARVDPERELRTGSAVPAVEGASDAKGKATALVFVGGRDDCATRSLMAGWREALRGQSEMRLLFVAERFDATLRTACEGKGPRPEIVRDPDGKLARRFNALWTPRSFLVSGDGRLLYAQPPATPDSRAAQEALGTLPGLRHARATVDPRGKQVGP